MGVPNDKAQSICRYRPSYNNTSATPLALELIKSTLNCNSEQAPSKASTPLSVERLPMIPPSQHAGRLPTSMSLT